MLRSRAIKIICTATALLVAIGLLPTVTVATRTRLTCALCRAERTDRMFLGCAWQRYHDTEFTDWYRSHRPSHDHSWGRLSCTKGFSILGTTTYFGCGPRHPVCAIPPATLRKFAEAAGADTLTVYFDGIISTNLKSQTRAVQMVWDQVLQVQ